MFKIIAQGRWPAIITGLLLLIFYLSAAIPRDFHSRGEPREAIVMQNMFSSGNVILPEGYAGVVPSKPPLLHWLGALFSIPFGEVSEITARMPSVLAAVFIGLLLFSFLSGYVDKRSAILSVFVLASSLEWLRSASTARVDMLLTAALFLSFMAMFRWAENNFKGYPWAMLLGVSAAILTKGPVGAVLPGIIFVVYSLTLRQSIKDIIVRSIITFLPAALLSSTWYLAAYITRPEEFLNKIYYENVARFLSQQEDEPHKASILKFYSTVLLGFLPWTLILLSQLVQNFKTVCSVKNIKSTFSGLPKFELFSLIVILCTLIFYSIPEGKREAYLLPIYPFLAYFLSKSMLSFSGQLALKSFFKPLCIFALLLIAVLQMFIFLPDFENIAILNKLTEVQASFKQYYITSGLLITLMLLSSLCMLYLSVKYYNRVRQETSCIYVGSLVLVLTVYVQIFIVPAVLNPISARKFVSQIKNDIDSHQRLMSFGEEFYAFSFYTGRKFMRTEQTPIEAGDLIFLARDNLSKLKNQFAATNDFKIIAESEGSVISYGKKVLALEVENKKG